MSSSDQRMKQWEHTHEAVIHTHAHYHVTHNFNESSGTFEHLWSLHEHEHDHGELTHTHFPHRDFGQEHMGEAHVHDHDMPVRQVRKKTTTRKAKPKTQPETSAESPAET